MKKLIGVAIVTAFLVACKDKSDAENKPTPPTSTTVASAAISAQPAATTSAAPAYTADINDLSGVFAKLQSEKANRPNADPSVEKVMDTISGKLGIALDDQSQLAAFTIGARYCAKAVTKTDIYLVVCEFSDAAAATKGVALGSATNKYIKRREVLQVRATTLAIQQDADNAASVAAAKKIKDAFLAL